MLVILAKIKDCFLKITLVNQLKQQILDLESISQSLEPNEVQRNTYLKKVNDYANLFLNSIETTNAFCSEKEASDVFKVNFDMGGII